MTVKRIFRGHRRNRHYYVPRSRVGFVIKIAFLNIFRERIETLDRYTRGRYRRNKHCDNTHFDYNDKTSIMFKKFEVSFKRNNCFAFTFVFII